VESPHNRNDRRRANFAQAMARAAAVTPAPAPFIAALALAPWMACPPAAAEVADAPTFGSLAPTLTLVRSGPPQVVYSWRKQQCTAKSVPDAPARAFREPGGDIRLIAAGFDSWSLVGRSFDHLHVDCHALWQGGRKANPGLYDDMSWIGATYALPSGIVIGLASNEWSAYRHREEAGAVPINCEDAHNDACLLYSITQIVSQDGGSSFRYVEGDHLAAALPYRFNPQPTQASSAGVATVSNIISRDGFHYVFLGVRGVGEQRSGSCLMRTSDLPHARAWRAWNGSDFSVEFADPYGGEPIEAGKHLCTPVAPDEVSSIQHVDSYDTYVGLFRGFGQSDEGRVIAGVFYATTPDLIHWSPWQLLMQIPAERDCREIIYHPSMLADDDATPNFEGGGDHPYLYFVRVNRTGCRPSIDSDLVRVPLEIRAVVQKNKAKTHERMLDAGAPRDSSSPWPRGPLSRSHSSTTEDKAARLNSPKNHSIVA
jgi:hypothetical protein